MVVMTVAAPLVHALVTRVSDVGFRPGRSLMLGQVPLLPAAVIVLVDVRRRWLAASLAFGAALSAVSTAQFPAAPALRPATPGSGDVIAGIVLTLAAALAGGRAAVAASFASRRRS
jgi:hypothetical protein